MDGSSQLCWRYRFGVSRVRRAAQVFGECDNNWMVAHDAQETVARFVLRARRIESHSLVREWDELLRHAQGSFEASLDLSGKLTVTRRLPEDEEAFESLAARVRPLTLKTEPVYHDAVLTALQNLIERSTEATDEQRARCASLRQAWQAAELQGTHVQGYAVQSMRLDGSDVTPMVSDTQLAAGWLYADLVHADAKGPKKQALLFPLRERYAAAVRIFSRVAALTVTTLQFVETLRKAGIISIAEQAWQQDVSVGAAELVDEATALIADSGMAMPDLQDLQSGLASDWRPFTVTDLLRQDPSNHVQVVVTGPDASVLANYEAAVAHRRIEDDVMHWHVLVAGSVMIHFTFEIRDNMATRPSVKQWTPSQQTNALILASQKFMLQLHAADTVEFRVGNETIFMLNPSRMDNQALLNAQILCETVSDIIAIETLSDVKCSPCIQPFNDLDRIRLRQARLTWEGHAVRSERKPLRTVTENGNLPQAIVVKRGTRNIGGADVPVPTMCLRHPEMMISDLGPAPGVGPEARKFEVTPPSGERLLAWCPDTRTIASDDDLAGTTAWGLIGIDEGTFPY